MKRSIATIGMFDGVHCGHRYLIEQMIREAQTRSLLTRVFSFDSHPLATIRPECAPPMLTTPQERATLITSLGVDHFTSIAFTPQVQCLSAREFMTKLHNEYHVDVIILGFNNRFGCDRLKDIADYQHIGSELGIEVLQAQEYSGISSSIIRQYLINGNITKANSALTRPYQLSGTVVSGKQLGRTIGFPTANIQPTYQHKLIPGNGVYACIATTPDGSQHPAMVNIGHRPTVDLDNAPISIEAHLIDYNADLYEKELKLDFIDFVRPEQRFNTLDDLISQLHLDRQKVISIITSREVL